MIWRTAKTIAEAKKYTRAMRALGLTVSIYPNGEWRDASGAVSYIGALTLTSWRKGVVRGRYPDPKKREVLTATERSRILVQGLGPASSPEERTD
jgi:hypothetical protein